MKLSGYWQLLSGPEWPRHELPNRELVELLQGLSHLAEHNHLPSKGTIGTPERFKSSLRLAPCWGGGISVIRLVWSPCWDWGVSKTRDTGAFGNRNNRLVPFSGTLIRDLLASKSLLSYFRLASISSRSRSRDASKCTLARFASSSSISWRASLVGPKLLLAGAKAWSSSSGSEISGSSPRMGCDSLISRVPDGLALASGLASTG